MSLLHELAEARNRPSQDRRRESWAEVRAEIDAMLAMLQPQTEREYRIILRAYGIGMGRAAKMMPRQQTTLTAQEFAK